MADPRPPTFGWFTALTLSAFVLALLALGLVYVPLLDCRFCGGSGDWTTTWAGSRAMGCPICDARGKVPASVRLRAWFAAPERFWKPALLPSSR